MSSQFLKRVAALETAAGGRCRMVERVHRLGLTTRRMPFHEASLAVLDAREAGVKVDWPECSCEACTWLAGLPG